MTSLEISGLGLKLVGSWREPVLIRSGFFSEGKLRLGFGAYMDLRLGFGLKVRSSGSQVQRILVAGAGEAQDCVSAGSRG